MSNISYVLTHNRGLVLEDLEGFKDLLSVAFVSVGEGHVPLAGRLNIIELSEDSMSETLSRGLDGLTVFSLLGFGGDVQDAQVLKWVWVRECLKTMYLYNTIRI